MPVFKVTFDRHVSRTVELKQIAIVYLEAADEKQAKEAADEIVWDKDLVDENCTEWSDVAGSRQASNDEEERGVSRRVVDVLPVRVNFPVPLKATEILNINPETPEDDE